MIGVLLQLALSWLVVWSLYRENLTVLGLRPTGERLRQFGLFLLVSMFFSASGFWLKMMIIDSQWIVNPDANAELLLGGIWFNIKSVLYEELIFRGALFYVLIRWLGPAWAITVSSATFGGYHWFSQGSWGDPGPMIITFFVTGVMGLVLAFGYLKTKSLYVPVAIHLGWNSIQQVVFSSGPIGEQWLILANHQPEVTLSYVEFFFMLIFPIAGEWLVCAYLIHQIKSKSAREQTSN